MFNVYQVVLVAREITLENVLYLVMKGFMRNQGNGNNVLMVVQVVILLQLVIHVCMVTSYPIINALKSANSLVEHVHKPIIRNVHLVTKAIY